MFYEKKSFERKTYFFEIFEEFLLRNFTLNIWINSLIFLTKKWSFQRRNCELKVCTEIILYSGYHRFPQKNMYGKKAIDTAINNVSKNISRKHFKD